ncbi:MAG: ribonuclease R [Nitrospirae bacterium]|nr:ribonuclease R [Nitrospirota bacterium]
MMNKKEVSSFFREKVRRPLSFREIVEQMGLGRAEGRSLKRVLREMLREGELVLNRKGMYGPSDNMDLSSGYYEAHKAGFGFVIHETPGQRDIFVPAGSTAGAMNGDRVIVKVEDRRRRGGRIIRVLERAYTRVTGTLEISKNAGYVKPRNRFIQFDLYIASKDMGDAVNGDMVIAEITEYPSDKRPPSGRIIKVVRQPENPGEDIELIIDEFNLPRRFPKTVTDEAKALAEESSPASDTPKRKDLRKLPTVTIDGERAKDFDDAVSIARTDNGYRLWVHIADVGSYVRWGSAIDMEARKRGTSVYFPDRVIPMLPKELSEDLCSLKPGVERRAFTVEMDFDKKAARTEARFFPSLIISDERMTYTSVRKVLTDRDKAEMKRYEKLIPDFELMGELCGVMRDKRLRRGSLDFDLPEPDVLLDIQGNPEAIIKAERNFAHKIIEEFMIAANEAVAEHLEQLGIPCVYRIHEEPDSSKMEDIIKVLRPLIRTVRQTFRPKDFPDLLRSAKDSPSEELINYIILRSLKQARYSPVNVGHFGLASKSYAHFTSPIRRYPDLVVHRILRELLTKKTIPEKRLDELKAILPDISFSSSRMERRSSDAEYASVNAMRVWFMKDKVGEEFDGKVAGVTPYGLKIRLNEFYIDGFINLSDMTDDFYQYNENSMTLSGRNTKRIYRLGQELRLRVDRVNMQDREIIFGLVKT